MAPPPQGEGTESALRDAGLPVPEEASGGRPGSIVLEDVGGTRADWRHGHRAAPRHAPRIPWGRQSGSGEPNSKCMNCPEAVREPVGRTDRLPDVFPRSSPRIRRGHPNLRIPCRSAPTLEQLTYDAGRSALADRESLGASIPPSDAVLAYLRESPSS